MFNPALARGQRAVCQPKMYAVRCQRKMEMRNMKARRKKGELEPSNGSVRPEKVVRIAAIRKGNNYAEFQRSHA